MAILSTTDFGTNLSVFFKDTDELSVTNDVVSSQPGFIHLFYNRKQSFELRNNKYHEITIVLQSSDFDT